MKIVQVVWVDSVGMTPDWEHKDEIEPLKPANPTSVGFLLDDNSDYVTLLQTDSETQLMGRLTIPRISIVSMETLNIQGLRGGEKAKEESFDHANHLAPGMKSYEIISDFKQVTVYAKEMDYRDFYLMMGTDMPNAIHSELRGYYIAWENGEQDWYSNLDFERLLLK